LASVRGSGDQLTPRNEKVKMQRFVYFIVGFVLQHMHGNGDPKQQQQHYNNNHFTALCPGLPG